MTTTTKAADEQTAIEQVNSKAQETLDRLSARWPEIERTIRTCEEEIAVFPQQREALNARLTSERNTFTTLQTTLSKAESYARVAMGTLGEQSAIKAVSKAKKALVSGQKHFEAIQGQIAKEQEVINVREQELTAKIDTLRKEYLDTQSEWRDVEAARQQAHAELGAMKATAIMDQSNEWDARERELTEQLVKLKVERHDFVEEAIKDLAPWSDHRAALRKKYPAHDETAEVLEHEIAYISSLLSNSQVLPYDERLYNLLAIPVGELHHQEHLRQNPKSLRARLAELQTLLTQHQASLQR